MSNNTDDLIPDHNGRLYFDIGNSAIKVSYLANEQWVHPFTFSHDEMDALLEWLSDLRQACRQYVISSVVPDKTRALTEGLGSGKNRQITFNDIPDRMLDYETPESLGIDRFLAACGAWSINQNATVVVDAGTACTIDFIDSKAVFRGGSILPGRGLLEKALQKHAPNLPVAERRIPDRWPGKTTTECLQWGIYGGFADMVKGALDRYQDRAPYELYLTGGHAAELAGQMNRSFKMDPWLVFRGMKYLLDQVD